MVNTLKNGMMIGVFLLLQSCMFTLPTADDLPTWSPEIFGPVAKMDLNLERLSDLASPEITRTFLPEDLGLEEGTSPVPPFQVDEVGPVEFELEAAIQAIQIQRADATIAVSSTLPVALEPGSRVELRNEANQLVVAFDFNERLRPNSTINQSVTIRDAVISSNIRFFVYNIRSNGSREPVTFNENTNISVTLGFEELQIEEIQFKRNQEIVIDEQFPFNGSENLVSDAVEVEGEFTLVVENGYPLSIPLAVQVYNQNADLLFELVDDVIAAPNVGRNGRVNGPSAQSSISIPITENQLQLLQQAAVIRLLARVQSGGNNNGYVLERGRSLSVKLISNLSILID